MTDSAQVNQMEREQNRLGPRSTVSTAAGTTRTSSVASESYAREAMEGCGRGYDVIAFAKRQGMVAVGADISETALDAAREYAKSVQAPSDKVQFRALDFFNFDAEAGFDIVYDLTFLCALEIPLRPRWAARMAELIIPGGLLITYMFPLRPEDEKGPPFALSEKVYEDLLAPNFDKIHEKRFEPLMKIGNNEMAGKIEVLAIWRR
ncbi:hypothetical protein HDV05_000791, partial [Chytridiales sp. JEL 0842]